jgi:aryl-alcohol dehydrogenase-like predicted oxidoreductase
MQYKKLGRTGLRVSPIALGTMFLGAQVDETESIKIIKGAMAAGVNFLDTSDGYAGGRSEEIIGKALKGERHSVVVATKAGGPTGPGPNEIGLSRAHIMQAVEGSLRRLQTDYIDLYYVHLPDFNTPIEETLRAMDDLVHQGKVRYIGCSNFFAWQLAKALCVSYLHDLVRFDCIEPPYNLLTRDIESELLPLCASEGVGVCVYNPLAAQMLTGRYDFSKPPAEVGGAYLERYWSEINFKAVDRFKEIAKKHGCTLAQFALAWILSNETITSALSGSTSLEQLEENLPATEIKLSPEELKACDEVWLMFRLPRYQYGKKPEDMEIIAKGVLKFLEAAKASRK